MGFLVLNEKSFFRETLSVLVLKSVEESTCDLPRERKRFIDRAEPTLWRRAKGREVKLSGTVQVRSALRTALSHGGYSNL